MRDRYVIVLAPLVLTMLFSATTIPHPKLAAVSGLCFLGALVWFVVTLRGIPCPRCFRSLGVIPVALEVRKHEDLRCPHCNASVDDPLPVNTNRIAR
jgi:hypothetical protein